MKRHSLAYIKQTKPYRGHLNVKKGYIHMKKTKEEIEEMGIHSERNYYSAVTVLCCGLGAGVCIALSVLVEYLAGRGL